jgi:hypothetical protein
MDRYFSGTGAGRRLTTLVRERNDYHAPHPMGCQMSREDTKSDRHLAASQVALLRGGVE